MTVKSQIDGCDELGYPRVFVVVLLSFLSINIDNDSVLRFRREEVEEERNVDQCWRIRSFFSKWMLLAKADCRRSHYARWV